MAFAPVAPEAPELAGLLIAIGTLLACLVALGLVTALHAFIRATVGGIAGIIGHVPYIGGVLSSPVNRVAHWMEHELSKVVLALDKQVGRSLHDIATLYHWIGKEIGDLAWTLYNVGNAALSGGFADYVYGQLHRINVLVHRVEHAATSALGRIEHTVERRTAGVLHRLTHRVAVIEHGLAGWVTGDLSWLRGRARVLERDYSNLFRRIKHLDYLLGAAVFTGAVAFALERLGLSWIKCRNWKKVGGGLCSLPFKVLEDLFAGVVDVLLITDLCAIVRYMVIGAREAQPLLDAMVTGMDELLACRGVTRPPVLTLRQPPNLPPLGAGPLALGG